MLKTTLPRLRCPSCGDPLTLPANAPAEVRSGELTCTACGARFPILAGVAILVEDVEQYLLEHVKGIARLVQDTEIPAEYREAYLDAKSELETEHIEEDLEAERVNALYVMTHYLRVGDGKESERWWAPLTGDGSPLIDSLIREHWDHGPFERIQKWVATLATQRPPGAFLELGCGVGGLYRMLRPSIQSYLGVDSSFASIALGRHFALGMPYSGTVCFPTDLLLGTVSRESTIPAAAPADGRADLIVGDALNPPVQRDSWDICATLNMIDMLPEPQQLPQVQHSLLKPDGIAIQSCPYVWHHEVAAGLREILPEGIRDSAQAVELLYQEAGFEIQERLTQVPWLFFKHVRQLEIYSTHLLLARKA